jgi:hypothetical protein
LEDECRRFRIDHPFIVLTETKFKGMRVMRSV